MRYITLEFAEDLHRDDLERFKRVSGCLGVSAYRSTLNLYFRSISRQTLFSLAATLQRELVETGSDVRLGEGTYDASADTHALYAALRNEVTA